VQVEKYLRTLPFFSSHQKRGKLLLDILQPSVWWFITNIRAVFEAKAQALSH
jgi:hypothetical protein